MDIKTIRKYDKYSVSKLVQIAQRHFNKYIRQRDIYESCISCGSSATLEAGHYYSAGHYPSLRFNEDNCAGQCRHCNRFLHGNLIEYRKGLANKIGPHKIEELDDIAAYYKRTGYKYDRLDLIEKIEIYKKANK